MLLFSSFSQKISYVYPSWSKADYLKIASLKSIPVYHIEDSQEIFNNLELTKETSERKMFTQSNYGAKIDTSGTADSQGFMSFNSVRGQPAVSAGERMKK